MGAPAPSQPKRGRRPAPPAASDGSFEPFHRWFADRGWKPFPFQTEVWQALAAGTSGVLHAPTGTGKTLAASLGAIARSAALAGDGAAGGLRVVWITPLRALAADTVRAIEEPLPSLPSVAAGWSVAARTGDTSTGDRRRLRENWPAILVTTPESLSILLSLDDAHEIFSSLETVIVDEWHELLSTKRGVQTELALERLRSLRPGLVSWGLSATLANLDDAVAALVGPSRAAAARLVSAHIPRRLEIETHAGPRSAWLVAGHQPLRLRLKGLGLPARGSRPQGHLFVTLEALLDEEKPMDIDRAKAVADVAQVIVNSAKEVVQVSHQKSSVSKGPGVSGSSEQPLA